MTGPFAGRDFTLDPRCKIAPRAEEAIFEEIAKLETRLKSLANGDPARADVLRQLTDGYFELGRRQGRGTDAATASFKESARYADLLIKEFPSDAKLQEVRYYRAIAFEWSAELDAERKALREYMQLYPKAPELPCVRLMLGESWISDGKNTPAKLRSARKEFKECAKIPATENACFTYAEYYLATIPENPEEITPPSRARKNIPSGSPASSGSPSSSGM